MISAGRGQEVYDAHPDWFYKRKDGGPITDDNSLYTTCINGGYYSDKAIEILTESLIAIRQMAIFLIGLGMFVMITKVTLSAYVIVLNANGNSKKSITAQYLMCRIKSMKNLCIKARLLLRKKLVT